jgi:hypothetical protein
MLSKWMCKYFMITCLFFFAINVFALDDSFAYNQPVPKNYSYKLVEKENKSWGYQIFRDEKLILDQPHIPGISGKKGFINSTEAAVVAKKVISKMKKGIFPPTITEEDLQKMKITIRNN